MNLRKEMIAAVVLGLILGIGAALVITKTPQKLFQQNKEKAVIPKQTPEPTPMAQTENPVSGLEVLLPQDQSLTAENEINVSGKAGPKQTVLIATPFSENVAVASDDGTFSAKIKLEEGANEIKVVAVFDGNFVEKNLVVSYTKEEI